MPTTHNHIWYPDNNDDFNPLETVFSAMASSIDENLGLPLFSTNAARDTAYVIQQFKLCVVGVDYSSGVLYAINDGTWEQVGDFQPPMAPTDLGVTSVSYVDSNGFDRARVLVSWTNPTKDVTGHAMTPGAVEVWGREGSSGSFYLMTSTTYPDDDVLINDLETATIYEFEVRALTVAGAPGAFSTPASHTTAAGSGGGATPDTPGSFSLSSKMLMVTITWNGLDNTGDPYPSGYTMLIERSSSSSFTSPVRVGLYPVGTTIAAEGPLVKGYTYYYKLSVLDMRGNLSVPSVRGSVTVNGISAPDLIAGSIHANSVDAGVLNGTQINGVSITGSSTMTSPTITGGTFRTAEYGTRVEISDSAADGDPGVGLFDSSYGYGGSLRISSGAAHLRSPSASGYPGVVAISESAFSVSMRGGTVLSFPAPQSGNISNINSGGGMSISANGNLNLNGTSVNINGSPPITGSVVRPGDSISTTGSVSCDTLILDKISNPSSGTGDTLVRRQSDGAFLKNTSSRRYKEEIVDLTGYERVLDLRPVYYKYKTEPDQIHRIGLIAEEVNEIMPELVTVDEDGLPNGVQYQAGWVNLIPVIKDMARRIDELEAALEATE